MNVRDLVPFWRPTTPSAHLSSEEPQASPFLTLHREVNHLFDDVFSAFPSTHARMPAWPSVEVSETESAYTLSAELPGLGEEDVEVLVADNALVLRGEKHSETRDEEKRFTERSYGRFERRVPLLPDVDQDRIEASFDKGVLTVTLPKDENAPSRMKRIRIGKSAASADEQVH